MHALSSACTRADAYLPANKSAVKPPTRDAEYPPCAKGCTQQLQNRAGTGANLSFRGPRLPGMPILLQHSIQFARHKVQLLSEWSEIGFFADTPSEVSPTR